MLTAPRFSGRLLSVLSLIPILAACGSTRSAPPASGPSSGPAEIRYVFLFGGNPAGKGSTRIVSDRERIYEFEFNDRGRGPRTTTRLVVDERSVPVREEISGHDYWKVPVDERLEISGGRATWRNAAERGERALDRPVYYSSFNGPPQEAEILVRALLQAPDNRLDLLPDGEVRLDSLGPARLTAGGGTRTVHLYALSGAGFTPNYVWLDEDRNLFASYGGWAAFIREGWESAVPEISRIQDAKDEERELAQARRLARRPKGALVIQDARLFDPETGTTLPDTTVVVAGDRIAAVGRDGDVQVPAGAEVIDARGRMLMPGLWDSHAHLSTLDGILDLAAGVTTARDLANDIDQLLDMRRRFDSGEALGPRVVMAGFIDGPGPYAGPTKVLVDAEEEALAAVDRYAGLGYAQIKLYSSLKPELVPPIVRRAHEKGMRVSGHIPYGMTAEQAVRAGFDEIQHVNFLFLNFLAGVDTRTPARFTAVGDQGADLDLRSPRVRDFLALLKEKGTVCDPTLVAFEGMFTDEAGKVGRTFAAVADRLPPQVRRGTLAGGMAPEGKAERYRDSYEAMMSMVRALHDNGIPIVAGTDNMAGFSLHRELELYVEAGIPNADALRAATLVPAQVMKRDHELGTIAPGKLADMILIDGDPAARIGDIRRVVLTLKDGVLYDPAALYREIGVKPVE